MIEKEVLEDAVQPAVEPRPRSELVLSFKCPYGRILYKILGQGPVSIGELLSETEKDIVLFNDLFSEIIHDCTPDVFLPRPFLTLPHLTEIGNLYRVTEVKR